MDCRVLLHPAAHRAERALSVSVLQKLSGHRPVIQPLCSDWQLISGQIPILIKTESAPCERDLRVCMQSVCIVYGPCHTDLKQSLYLIFCLAICN